MVFRVSGSPPWLRHFLVLLIFKYLSVNFFSVRPLDVRITNTQPYLSAGKTVMLECESSGSRPRAVITWWKGPDKVMTDNEVISDNGNLTLSTLSFIPTPEDNGKKFTCTAENPSLANSLLEDFRIVTVHCKYTILFVYIL